MNIYRFEIDFGDEYFIWEIDVLAKDIKIAYKEIFTIYPEAHINCIKIIII